MGFTLGTERRKPRRRTQDTVRTQVYDLEPDRGGQVGSSRVSSTTPQSAALTRVDGNPGAGSPAAAAVGGLCIFSSHF